MPVQAGVAIPPRSRTFTERDARVTAEALAAGQNVGYGDFDTEAAARSAGNALNKILADMGLSTGKFATTVFAVDIDVAQVDADGNAVVDDNGQEVSEVVHKFRGVIKPEAAKAAPAKKGKGKK